MKKTFALLFTLILILICASAMAEKVGVALPTDDLQRWVRDGANFEKQLKNAGYEVELQFADNDVSLQLAQIEAMINDGCEVVVVAAVDGGSLGSALAIAAEKGVKIIAYDRLLYDTDAVSYYVTTSNLMVGILQGNHIKNALGLGNGGGPYNIEFTAGAPEDNNARLFYDGAMSVLKPYIESGVLVVPSGQTAFNEVYTGGWRTEKAQQRAESILSNYYAGGKKIDAWLCSNDSTATGVIQALESGYTNQWPVITGQDCDVRNVKYMIVGKQAMSVYRDTSVLVSQTVKMVKQIINGETVDINDTSTYNNNVKTVPTYLCSPTSVTAKNYKEILIDTGYYSADLFTDLPTPPAEPDTTEKIKAFVNRCYTVILGREADPEGLEAWADALASGARAASEIIDGFVNSQEFLNKGLGKDQQVVVLYKAMLGREPDPAGLAAWTDVLNQGYPFGSVINGFCGSTEFKALCAEYGIQPGSVNVGPVTPAGENKIKAFVRRCYSVILGRDADPDGLNAWAEALETGVRKASEIIDGFVNSPEFLNKNLSKEEQVDVLYQAMLGRGADPAGKAAWVQVLNDGNPFAAVINGFCGSTEFINLCNEYGIQPGSVQVMAAFVKRVSITPEGSDAEESATYVAYASEYINEEKIRAFVKHCYETVLGREGDEEGITNYTALVMDGKKTPKRVAYEFVFSPEFQGKLPGNEELVKILYRLYLNREPGAEELAGWIEMLDGGAGLDEVLKGFAESAEFRAIMREMKE